MPKSVRVQVWLRSGAALFLTCWLICVAAEEDAAPDWQHRSNVPVGWLVYGGGVFVGVGSDGLIASSPDGQLWTLPNSNTTNHLGAAIYTGSQFVCVGGGGTILTSPDGLTWTRRASGTERWLASIASGNGAMVAVGGDSIASVETQVALRSTNGIDWEVIREQPGPLLYRVAFGAGRFLAMISNGSGFLSSTDGKTWQTNEVTFSAAPVHLVYTGDRFFAQGSARDAKNVLRFHILTSANGVDWTDFTVPQPEAGYGPVAFGAGIYIAAGSLPPKYVWDWIRNTGWWGPETPLMLTSTNGLSWRQETSPGLLIYHAVYGQQTFVAAGRMSTNSSGIYQSHVIVPRFERSPQLGPEAFTAEVVSDPGESFLVQRSENFKSWTDVVQVTNAVLRTRFTDPLLPGPLNRFYRVMPLAGAEGR